MKTNAQSVLNRFHSKILSQPVYLNICKHIDKQTHTPGFKHFISYYSGKRLGLFANLDSIFHLSNVYSLKDLKIAPVTNITAFYMDGSFS